MLYVLCIAPDIHKMSVLMTRSIDVSFLQGEHVLGQDLPSEYLQHLVEKKT